MRGRTVVSSLAAALLIAAAACSDDGSDTGGDGGTGGQNAGGDAASAGAGGGGPSGGGTGGISQTCDDLGFCGEPNDPGCVTCAITEGSCVDELEACDAECDALSDCYTDCDSGDAPCIAECEEMHPNGVAPWGMLYGCILCVECPVSCNFDPSNCT